MMSDLNQQLTAIAREHLLVETLDTRRRDSLDFYDCSVWGIRTALKQAYELGKAEGAKCATSK